MEPINCIAKIIFTFILFSNSILLTGQSSADNSTNGSDVKMHHEDLIWKTETDNRKQDSKVTGQSETKKIVSNFKDEVTCYSTSVNEFGTKIDYFEWLKENRESGVFYTFDDESRTVSTVSRTNVNGSEIIKLKSIICTPRSVTEIDMESCAAFLAQNRAAFRKLVNEKLLVIQQKNQK